MKRKYIYILMQLFTSICVVSVGFASWTFVSGDSIIASGSIKAEDIHSNDKYVELVSCDIFRYYDTGFLTGTGQYDSEGKEYQQITNQGKISYIYTIDLYDLKSSLDDQTSLKISFTLSHTDITNYTLIDDYASLSYLKLNDVVLSSPKVTSYKDNNTYTVVLDIYNEVSTYSGNADDESTRYLTLSFEYLFDTSSVDFYSEIYPCFSNNAFQFNQRIDVEFK